MLMQKLTKNRRKEGRRELGVGKAGKKRYFPRIVPMEYMKFVIFNQLK